MKILLSPDEAGGGAAGESQVATETTGGELFSSERMTSPGASAETTETTTTHEGEGEPATEAIRSPGLTKDDIKELVDSIGASRQAPEASRTEERQPLSEQELEKMFNVWKPSADFIVQLRHESPETALQALTQMRDGMMKQAMSMAEYRVNQLLGQAKTELTGQITPLSEYVSEQRATAFRNDFFKDNSDLEPYEKLVDSVAARLYQSGGNDFLKLDRAARMKLFADESRKLVKELLAKGGEATGGNGGKATQTTTRKMSTLTSGGPSGGRGSGGGKPTTGNRHVDDGLAALD